MKRPEAIIRRRSTSTRLPATSAGGWFRYINLKLRDAIHNQKQKRPSTAKHAAGLTTRTALTALALLLIAGTVCAVLPIGKASALATACQTGAATTGYFSKADLAGAVYTWVNEATIQVNISGDCINFSDPTALNEHNQSCGYLVTNCQSGGNYAGTIDPACNSDTTQVSADTDSPGSATGGQLWYQPQFNAGCQEYNIPSGTPIGSTGNSNIIYQWSGNSIVRVANPGSGYVFTQDPEYTTVFVDTAENGTCDDEITFTSTTDMNTGDLWEISQTGGGNTQSGYATPPEGTLHVTGCSIAQTTDDINGMAVTGGAATIDANDACPVENFWSGNDNYGNDTHIRCSQWPRNSDGSFTIHIGGTPPTDLTGGGAPPPPTAPQADECPITSWALRWIACPIFDAIIDSTQTINEYLQALLTTPTSYFTDTNKVGTTGYAYFQAWGYFRDLAVSVLVIAALIMVIGESAGFELLDAYTIRKVLPRLLVAAVLLTISWPLMAYLVGFFNDMGNWIADILIYPFGSLHPLSTTYSATGTAATIAGGTLDGVVGIAAVGALIIVDIPLILSLVASLLLALFIAYITLTIRQMIITICIITAPLAVAAYILPTTQKVWDFWRDAFVSALMVFPIVSAFLAVGRIVAAVAGSQSGAIGLLAPVAVIVSYATLGTAFKAAGGLMGRASGMVSNFHGGATNGLKGWRKKRVGEDYKGYKEGSLMNNKLLFNPRYRGAVGRLGRAVNSSGAHYGLGFRNRYGLGAGVGAGAWTDLHANESREHLKHHPELVSLAERNDNAAAVVAGSGDTIEGARQAAADLATANGWSAAQTQRVIDDAMPYIGTGNAQAMIMEVIRNKARAVPAGRNDIIQSWANRASHGSPRIAEDIMYNAAFAGRSGAASRPDLGGPSNSGAVRARQLDLMAKFGLDETRALNTATMIDGMKRTDARVIRTGAWDGSMTQLSDTIRLLQKSKDIDDRTMAGRWTYELQRNLSDGGTSDAVADIIRDLMHDPALNIDMSASAGTNVTDQIVKKFKLDTTSMDDGRRRIAESRAWGEQTDPRLAASGGP